MPKIIPGRDVFMTNIKVAGASPFETVKVSEGRLTKISCEITNEGRKRLASIGIGNKQLMDYVGKPGELINFLEERGCEKEIHYTEKIRPLSLPVSLNLY